MARLRAEEQVPGVALCAEYGGAAHRDSQGNTVYRRLAHGDLLPSEGGLHGRNAKRNTRNASLLLAAMVLVSAWRMLNYVQLAACIFSKNEAGPMMQGMRAKAGRRRLPCWFRPSGPR